MYGAYMTNQSTYGAVRQCSCCGDVNDACCRSQSLLTYANGLKSVMSAISIERNVLKRYGKILKERQQIIFAI